MPTARWMLMAVPVAVRKSSVRTRGAILTAVITHQMWTHFVVTSHHLHTRPALVSPAQARDRDRDHHLALQTGPVTHHLLQKPSVSRKHYASAHASNDSSAKPPDSLPSRSEP